MEDTNENIGGNNKEKSSDTPLPELKLSTRSFIISVNCTFNLEKLKAVPRIKYIIKSKVRGRKKKVETIEELNNDIIPGSFVEKVYLNSEGEPNLKKRKKKVFGNSETMIIFLNKEKLVNFKVFVNGSIQMTGAKNIEQAKETIKYFMENIRRFDESIINVKDAVRPAGKRIGKGPGERPVKKERLTIYFIPNLCNMNFSIGFMINRNSLDQYMKTHTRYRSLWFGSGYAAVRLNLPVVNYEDRLVICKMVMRPDKKRDITEKLDQLSLGDNPEKIENLTEEPIKEEQNIIPIEWKHSTLSYSDYGRLFPHKKVKEKSITFHVFHSGKINMSSIDENIMNEYFVELVGILYRCKSEIEETLE